MIIRHQGKPVAYEIFNINGTFHHHFVHEEHRRQGLGGHVELRLSQKVIRLVLLVKYRTSYQLNIQKVFRPTFWHYCQLLHTTMVQCIWETVPRSYDTVTRKNRGGKWEAYTFVKPRTYNILGKVSGRARWWKRKMSWLWNGQTDLHTGTVTTMSAVILLSPVSTIFTDAHHQRIHVRFIQ